MASLSFNDWDLEKHVADAIGRLGWEEPTQIQLEAIPFARKGMDVVGQGTQERLQDPHDTRRCRA